jgi:hypothetical protein
MNRRIHLTRALDISSNGDEGEQVMEKPPAVAASAVLTRNLRREPCMEFSYAAEGKPENCN